MKDMGSRMRYLSLNLIVIDKIIEYETELVVAWWQVIMTSNLQMGEGVNKYA